MKKFAFLLLLPALALIQACDQSRESASDPTDEIREVWDTFVKNWEAGDAKACAAAYAENAVNVPPNFKVNQGRKDIEDFYAFLFASNPGRKYNHTIHSVSFSDQMVVELGAFQADWVRDDGTEWSFQARSLTHWEKGPDGAWKIKSFMFNQPPEAD